MLHRLPPEADSSAECVIHWYERAIPARAGDTVASALLLAGVTATRNNVVSGAGRLPFCMMGTCFECLLEIDGQVVQGCLTPVRAGMQVRMPDQLPLLAEDL